MNQHETLISLLNIQNEPTFCSQTVKVPGKLYIAGEYAILEKGQAAILVALDAYLSCTVKLSANKNSGSILSPAIQATPYNYKRTSTIAGILPKRDWPKQWAYILSAIQIVEQLVTELKYPIQDYVLEYHSDLISTDGIKYGLGSSGAVTVATVSSLLKFYGLDCPKELIYKIAALASLQVSTKGSLGDIAATTYGGWIYYQSPNRQYLLEQLANNVPVASILSSFWKDLAIYSLNVPDNVRLLIGWTQASASTDELVDQYQTQIETNSPEYQQFLTENSKNIRSLAIALESGHLNNIHKQLIKARTSLKKITRHWNLLLETPTLEKLIDIAQHYQYEAKSSGAGGGDCGIAIGDVSIDQQPLINAWQSANIYPLPFHVTPTL